MSTLAERIRASVEQYENTGYAHGKDGEYTQTWRGLLREAAA